MTRSRHRRIPVGPVSDHVLDLADAGWTYDAIAAASGVSIGTIEGLSRGWYWSNGVRKRQTTVQAATADLILGVPIWSHRIATLRRIQSLMALGWSTQHVADAANVPLGRVKSLLYRPDFRGIDTATADSVKRAYAALWDKDGTSCRHGKARATRARARGWAPPAAWDDDTIGHPNAQPYGVRTGPDRTAHTDTDDLLDLGLTANEIATLRGVHPTTVLRAIQRRTTAA